MSEQDANHDRPDHDGEPKNDPNETGEPKARIRRTPWRGWIWAVPLAAIILVGYLVVRTWLLAGPTITVTFPAIDGLSPEGTPVHYRGVQVGTVQSVELIDHDDEVQVTLSMDGSVSKFLRTGTQFWIVKPDIFSGDVSNLLSGAYIAMRPGQGEKTSEFKGLERPPQLLPQGSGRTFTVYAPTTGSLRQGSTVLYRGAEAGQVLGVSYDADRDSFRLQVFVHTPFAKLVQPTSRFWRCGGISLDTQGGGLGLRMPSLGNLLQGCLTFDNVKGQAEGASALFLPLLRGRPGGGRNIKDALPSPNPSLRREGSNSDSQPAPSTAPAPTFQLYDSEQAARNALRGQPMLFTVRFPDSIAGLEPGSPVTYQGIEVGKVRDVTLRYDAAHKRLVTPVALALYPSRFGLPGADRDHATQLADEFMHILSQLVGQGLRAQLTSSNFILGSKEVALVMAKHPAPAALDLAANPPRLPAIGGGGIASVLTSVSQITDSISAIPFQAIGKNIEQLTSRVAHLADSPEVKQSLEHLNATLANVQQLTGEAKGQIKPLLKSLNDAAKAATDAAKTINRVAGGSLSSGADVQQLVAELTRTARSIRVLADYLQRHPEALLQGKTPR